MENQSKSKYEKGRKDKTKIKEVEENWKSDEMGRVAERKVATGQGRWLGYSSWRQTMKLLVKIYQHIDKFTKAA